jgi:hypothetical protein
MSGGQTARPLPVPPSWTPGEAVQPDTPLGDIFRALGFGLSDLPSWATVLDKLRTRRCTTVADLLAWNLDELMASLKTLRTELHKAPKSYLASIESALGHTFIAGEDVVETDDTVTSDGKTKKTKRGGNMTELCSKVEPSPGFDPACFTLDGRCYADLQQKGTVKCCAPEEEIKYLDKAWLYVQVSNPRLTPSPSRPRPHALALALTPPHPCPLALRFTRSRLSAHTCSRAWPSDSVRFTRRATHHSSPSTMARRGRRSEWHGMS